MSETVEWNGRKYTKHIHNANWEIMNPTYVYYKPYTDSKHVNNGIMPGVTSTETHAAKWKTTIDNIPWYYFATFGGWIPWKYGGKQIIKRIGAVEYCEEDNNKSMAEAIDTSTYLSGKEPAPRIDSYIDTESSEYKDFLRSKMIINDDKNLWNSKFNRLQFANPYHAIGPTREYLFFTKFDLHLFNPGTTALNPELSNDPFWLEMKSKYKPIIQQLQHSAGESPLLPFMPILTNASASSLDMPSQNGETSETGQTIYGTTIQYRQGSFKSDEGYDFSLEFKDSPALEVFHLFKMYNEYENIKSLGLVTPPKYNDGNSNTKKMNRYTVDKILHDQIGIYKIIVGEDMETIIYYAYLWGAFPKSVPRDSFRDIEPGIIKYSIDWHAQFVDDMQPEILIDFNNLVDSHLNIDSESELWNSKLGIMNGNWVGCPYITISKDSSFSDKYRYKLKWYNDK